MHAHTTITIYCFLHSNNKKNTAKLIQQQQQQRTEAQQTVFSVGRIKSIKRKILNIRDKRNELKKITIKEKIKHTHT